MNREHTGVTLPTQRCSSGMPPQTADTSTRCADPCALTQYLPSLGDLPSTGLLAYPLDLDAERAAALRAALPGHRTDDEHLALLDRVLRALRRI